MKSTMKAKRARIVWQVGALASIAAMSAQACSEPFSSSCKEVRKCPLGGAVGSDDSAGAGGLLSAGAPPSSWAGEGAAAGSGPGIAGGAGGADSHAAGGATVITTGGAAAEVAGGDAGALAFGGAGAAASGGTVASGGTPSGGTVASGGIAGGGPHPAWVCPAPNAAVVTVARARWSLVARSSKGRAPFSPRSRRFNSMRTK